MIGYDAILKRLLAVLEADAELARLADEFRLGELPQRTDASTASTVYVSTSPSSFQTREGLGSAAAESERASIIRLEIGLVASRGLPEKAKEALMQMADAVLRILRANPRLELPESEGGGDPLWQRSVVAGIEENPAGRGSLIQDAMVIVQAVVGPQWRAVFPDLTLDLLSRPMETPRINLDVDRGDDSGLSFSQIDREGTLHIEYEDTFDVHEAVREMLDATDIIDLKLQLGEKERAYKVILREPMSTAQFDQINRAVLQMSIVR